MPISITKCDAALGAEIGVDLSRPLDDATFRQIEDAFHDNVVVFFRGQILSNEQHIAFSRRFGELEVHIVEKYLLPGYPEILLVSNVKDAAGQHIGLADAGFTWHSDVSYRQLPSRCSLLYAKEVPVRDGVVLGDTVFANCVAAYEALPEPMKRRLDGLKAIHRYSSRRRIENSPRPKLTAAQLAETPDVAHPIVRTHPFTGRKAIYVTAGECIGIVLPDGAAMPEDESLDFHRRARRALRQARVPLPPPLAGRRSGDVGQRHRDAPGNLRLRVAGAAPHAPHHGHRQPAILKMP